MCDIVFKGVYEHKYIETLIEGRIVDKIIAAAKKQPEMVVDAKLVSAFVDAVRRNSAAYRQTSAIRAAVQARRAKH
jgi:hypothetical protein